MVKDMASFGHIFQKVGETFFSKMGYHQSDADCETADQSEDCLNKAKNKNGWKKQLLIGLAIIFMVLVTSMCGYIIFMVIQLAHNDCQNTQSIDGLHFNQEARFEEMEQVTTPSALKLASGATVLVHPADQMVKSSELVTVHCLFSQPVKCEWTRRGDVVDISGRYEYTTPRMDDGNSDCSIAIQSFRQLDVGQWQCFGVFDDQSSIATSTAKLTLPPTVDSQGVWLVDSPTDQKVAEGSGVTLQCTFNTPVECVWLRRGEHVEVKGRYSYVSPSEKQKSTDCSLTIEQLRPIDNGQWVCSTMADSSSVSVMSKPITISLVTP